MCRSYSSCCASQVSQRADVWTGGVYQVRQGQQRRIAVRVRPAHNTGTLPLVCQQILSIEVGSVTVRYEYTTYTSAYCRPLLNEDMQ